MTSIPVLVVISGPPGSGKTTLAHELARAVGCPAICRDEIKEGMVHAVPGFTAAPGDELTARTLPTFFRVLEVLLRAGVTTVAEAAFQDRLWRPRLEPLRDLARIRVVHCAVGLDVTLARVRQRGEDDPRRRAHADPGPGAAAESFRSFKRVSGPDPWLEVDTTDGYRPGLSDIMTFVNSSGSLCGDGQ